MWDDPRQLTAIALGFALLALSLLGWGAAAWAVRQPVFALRQVVIAGTLSQVNPANLEAVVREELRGNFFTMRLPDARQSLQRVPWVRNVALRRQWPNQLEIFVTEHSPLARWNDNALVNQEGEVFIADYDGELPQFTGPEGSAAEMSARFAEFGIALARVRLAIGEIRLSARGGWELRTTGAPALTIALGRNDPGQRLGRFVDYYPRTVGALARAGTRVEYADLRYRNGFAARVPGFKERPPKKAA
ncbi:MAG: cell division protein FtsQ/DivIB [Pseudomonadota bacterium]|nr:cell division protein FtsQ/DivIB [Pseudomonadota bacterium]